MTHWHDSIPMSMDADDHYIEKLDGQGLFHENAQEQF